MSSKGPTLKELEAANPAVKSWLDSVDAAFDGTVSANPQPVSVSLDELTALVEQIDALRPPSMTEGEVMRLVKYASDLAFEDGRRRALAEVCAYLGRQAEGLRLMGRAVMANYIDELRALIERGDTRPRGEGGKP